MGTADSFSIYKLNKTIYFKNEVFYSSEFMRNYALDDKLYEN